jgi:adenylate cyclase
MVSPVSETTDRCGSCGNDLRAKARFCDMCGAPSFNEQRQASTSK